MTRMIITATENGETDTLYLNNIYWVEFSEYRHEAVVFQSKAHARKFIEEECSTEYYTYQTEAIGDENADNA